MSEKLVCFFVFDRSVQKTHHSVVSREGSGDMRCFHRNLEAICLNVLWQGVANAEKLTLDEHRNVICGCVFFLIVSEQMSFTMTARVSYQNIAVWRVNE